MEGQEDGRTGGWKDRWMKRQENGKTGGWEDRRMEGQEDGHFCNRESEQSGIGLNYKNRSNPESGIGNKLQSGILNRRLFFTVSNRESALGHWKYCNRAHLWL